MIDHLCQDPYPVEEVWLSQISMVTTGLWKAWHLHVASWIQLCWLASFMWWWDFCGVICFYIQETNSGYQFSIYVARVCMTSIHPGRGCWKSLGKRAWNGLGWCFGRSQRSSLSPLFQLALAAIVLRVWMLSQCGIFCAGWTHLGSKLLVSIWVFGKYHTAVETCLSPT